MPIYRFFCEKRKRMLVKGGKKSGVVFDFLAPRNSPLRPSRVLGGIKEGYFEEESQKKKLKEKFSLS